jgi:PKD repeat protein
VSFSGAASSDPQGETLTYAWNFGDNGTGTGVSPTHTYATPGTYTVSLTVTNTSSLTGTATSTATIAAAAPTAKAGGPYTGTAGTAVSFSGAASTDPQGQTLTYAWNFGDSSTGTGVSPTHTYAAAGTYTVTLTVTNTSNLTATATSTATITVAALTDVALTGLVYGAQTPIVGAHVYLFAANTTGYGGAGIAASSSNASVSLLNAAETGTSDSLGAYVATGSNGGFSLTGDYTCTSGQQLYLYVLGGGNAAAGLLAAIGSCPASGSSAITVTVNEVTTIAAAYAMAGFATDATHVSSSGTALAQTGIANAFATAANLVSGLNGTALATTPAGNGTVPQTEIDTLANILASCVNTSSSCSTLLATATADGTATGTKPTDTATAAINVAHNPGANIAALYGMASTAVFTPKLSAQPNDFTIALNFTGGSINNPGFIAIDGGGNAWVANGFPANVSKLSSYGAAVSPSTGYTGGGLAGGFSGIVVDASGNVWLTNSYYPGSLTEFSNSGVALSPSTGYQGGIVYPTAMAIDGSGDVWISDNDTALVEFSNSGVALSPIRGYSVGGLFDCVGVAIDGSENVWVSNESGTISELSNSGSAISPSTGFSVLPSGTPLGGLAFDSTGNLWNMTDYALYKMHYSSGAMNSSSAITGGGLSYPAGMSIDGSGHIWLVNYYGGSGGEIGTISEFSNTGVAISPSTGFDASSLKHPYGIAADGSGNIWVGGGSSVVEFIGVGTPVVTPLSVGVKNNTLGTRP